MDKSRTRAAGSSRRRFLKDAVGVTAGTVLTGRSLWAQGRSAGAAAAAQTDRAFPKIDPQLMITPDQAWDWNLFKAQGGPTYAGSTGWKRYTDFLIAKMAGAWRRRSGSSRSPTTITSWTIGRIGAPTSTIPAWRWRSSSPTGRRCRSWPPTA